MPLYNILRNRLKPRFNKNFVKWRAGRKANKSYELHHLLGSIMGSKKLNDYLLAEIDPNFHTIITYNRKATEDEFCEMLVDALDNIFEYIDELEKGQTNV